MERIDPSQIAEAILSSAGWARIGITAPSEYLREQAAKELAVSILDRIAPEPKADVNQLALPI